MFKKLCRLFLFIITIFMVINVKANAINEIEMNVYLDDGGNATVEEIWNANLTQGTEGYQAFSNLNNITISNFSVMDDLGNMYESLSSWNTKGTFSDKRYKSGINYTFDGLELCWGISNYGSRKYTLKYKINNLVTQYTDNQGLYFNFLNLNQEVGKVKITIHADFLISLDNTRIWSFGNNGTINFDNGKIVMESKSGLTSSQYVVIMVKFNENVFSTTSISSKSFDNIYDEAFENNNSSNNSKINNMLLKLLLIIGGVFIFIPTLLFLVLRKIFGKIKLKDYSNGNHGKYLHFGKDGKKLPKEVSYWREIPCYKNINYAFWICDEFYLVDNDNLIKGLIGAYLLKWFKNDVIKIINSNGKYLIDIHLDRSFHLFVLMFLMN